MYVLLVAGISSCGITMPPSDISDGLAHRGAATQTRKGISTVLHKLRKLEIIQPGFHFQYSLETFKHYMLISCDFRESREMSFD